MVGRQLLFFHLALCLKSYDFLKIDPSFVSNHQSPRLARQTSADSNQQIALLQEIASFDCTVVSADVTEVSIWWEKDNVNITVDPGDSKYVLTRSAIQKATEGQVSSKLTVKNITWDDDGNYSCRARDGDTGQLEGEMTTLVVQAQPVKVATENGYGNVSNSLELSCEFLGKPVPQVTWLYRGKEIKQDANKYEITEDHLSDVTIKSLLKIVNLGHQDNDTYICHGSNTHNSDTAVVEAVVYDAPVVRIDYVGAVSSSKLFLNWTVVEWNQPIISYILSYREGGDNQWKYHLVSKIDAGSSSFLMSNLSASTEYRIKLSAKNKFGTGDFDTYHEAVKTLDFDPIFIAEVSIKGITKNSISVGWNEPPAKIGEHIHYYKVTKRSGEQVTSVIHDVPYPLHLWDNLEAATEYKFTVSACNGFSDECSPPSEVITGSTYDGLAGPPADVTMNCRSDNISAMNWVDVKWQPPTHPNGVVEFYNVELSGRARYYNSKGKMLTQAITPESKTEDADGNSTSRMTRFDFLKPNTNYSVRVCAVTGSKECGGWTSAACEMGVTPPTSKELKKFSWYSDERDGRQLFRLSIPRLSERNGAICCFRVIVVRLQPKQTASDLPPEADIPVTNYETAHKAGQGGAYIAEIFSSEYMGREVYVGDGQKRSVPTAAYSRCPACTPYGRGRRFTQLESTQVNPVEDGFLDGTYNYTAFVEVVVEGGAIGRSPYMLPRKPGQPDQRKIEMNTVLVSVLGVLAGLVLVAMILLVVLFMLRRYSKQVAAQQGVEMDLKHTFRHFCSTLRGRGHSQFLLTQDVFNPPDMPPIERDGMVAAYLERHKDSDYGFQSEFESLPEKFADRTTLNCDLPCNRPKNRYPDIKSYDQTRVKLAPVEEVEGSDYINSNYVFGYKERKRWICAQGPLESTLTDFWRMIYEQGVDIIIMLTNLEEYNRVKCAQYWPGAGNSTFGANTVAFVQERRYSDYVVRELKLTNESSNTTRQIYHYHYLQWKDFNAPEHAPAMLKFAKRINEAWSGSSPILVHCSAGVGRSGTLIAIDTLSQAMDEEGAVNIFQTVSDLRHQRNYLVQSVKQYQFVYRAIMEWSQFGDTERDGSQIKAHWVGLAQEKEGLMEEFARLAKVVDDRKALSVATNAENMSKNGSDSVIPYDRNRVILTPDGTRPHSTYINASFIEGYHNDESFIITQDPLQDTAMDFWRMVVEHNVATLVVLRGPEDGLWQYWPQDDGDRNLSFGYMTVSLVSRESRVSYVKREFKVVNTKAREEVHLTHFLYNEWSGESAEECTTVPSSTHGLLDLVEHALAHQEEASLTGPIAVHCRYGSERSSVYVALSILIQQIKRESRCDVFTTVRKLRAQRQGMVQHLSLYEFVYRAISDYVDLYRNKDEEYEYSVPVGTVAASNGTTKSAKSTGSGPYSVPVGTTKSTGSSGSAS